MTLPPSTRHPRLSAAAPARPHSPGTRTPSAPTSTIPHTHAIQAPAPRLAQSSLALKSQAPQGGAR